MPTYDYICKDCGDRFDHFQSMSSPPLTRREGCESKDCNVERVVSGGTGLIFKGSGFYLTDYKNSNQKNKDFFNSPCLIQLEGDDKWIYGFPKPSATKGKFDVHFIFNSFPKIK